MALTNVTLPFDTTIDKNYSTSVTGFNGHTATLQFLDELGTWIDVEDDSGASIVFTSNGQGTFTAPVSKMRYLIVAGTGNLAIAVTPTRTS